MGQLYGRQLELPPTTRTKDPAGGSDIERDNASHALTEPPECVQSSGPVKQLMATATNQWISTDIAHSNAVRRQKQKRRHNPVAQHNPLGRLQQQYLNGQISLAAITQRPIQRRPQLIETRSFTCQWTKQTKRFASSVQQIIHPQIGGWRIRLIALHIWSAPHTQRVAQFPSE